MTLWNRDETPTNIQTIEQAIVYFGEILQNAYPDKTVVTALDENGEELKARSIEANKFYWTAADPPEWRYSARFEIKLSPNHQIYGRIWEHALSLGDAAIPLQMRKVA